MRIASVCMMVAAVVLTGCGGDDGDGGTQPVTPVFTTFEVTPAAPTVVVGFTTTLSASAKDQNGAAMSGLTTTYASSDNAKATVTNAGVVTGVAAGTARITATGVIGGVTKTANVDVTVGAAPTSAAVAATAASQFSPNNVVVARNGTVGWSFAILHNVTFDTPGSPANIGDTATGTVSRTFPTAGTFAYHCTIHAGMTGSVVVAP
ncbi:MAG TPA: Ig-like domain-containing protein [Gemmatimonadaceae bacterium]|nr:Ig-like domain-containing protein [Gemmatimonadaceae bacterium]